MPVVNVLFAITHIFLKYYDTYYIINQEFLVSFKLLATPTTIDDYRAPWAPILDEPTQGLEDRQALLANLWSLRQDDELPPLRVDTGADQVRKVLGQMSEPVVVVEFQERQP